MSDWRFSIDDGRLTENELGWWKRRQWSVVRGPWSVVRGQSSVIIGSAVEGLKTDE
jgi:hypothetical protein